MRFIVCSDNHGLVDVLDKLRAKYPEAKAFLHCGDNEMSNEAMKGFHVVTGNNDYYGTFPEFLIVDLDELKVLITHGHTLPYGNRVQTLAQLAKEKGCALACYGHTHIYNETCVDDVLCLNPGSMNYNRDGSKPSYAIVDYDKGSFKITRALVEDL